MRYLLRRSRVLSVLSPLNRGELLEIGCGSGALLCDLNHLGFSVHGLETSNKAVGMSHELARLANSPHQVQDTAHGSWENRFDLVCAFDVLEHIQDHDQAIDNWLGWLKPGGRLVISVPAHRRRWGAGDEWAGHWRRYDRQDVLDLAATHKLHIEHIECYGFPLANATEVIGNHIYRRMINARGTTSKAEATASSGIARSNYNRISHVIDSAPARAALATADWVQRRFLSTDWGSGYLFVAQRQ